MKKLKNYLLVAILMIWVLLMLILRYWPDSYTHVIFCDVGQGDAILITSGFTQILIDAGLGEEVSQCLSDYMPFWDKQLEVILATHADSDHITGFPRIFESYRVKKVILPQVGDDSSIFKDFQTAVLKEKDSLERVEIANFGNEILISDTAKAQILWPILHKVSKNNAALAWEVGNSERILEAVFLNLAAAKEAEIDKNDASIVLLLSIGKTKFLLMGDLGTNGEQSLLSRGLINKTQLLKAGHHGSKTSSSWDFLKRVQPEKIIISSGKNNSYGHPSPEVLDRFVEIGAKILRTDELGSIEIISNGEDYWIKN